jgi:hypothetical protein
MSKPPLPLATALVALLLPTSLAEARTAPSGFVYSSASAHLVQRQPAANSCHASGHTAAEVRPDPRCTPGAVNPAVTQATIRSTICRSGWTKTVRPPVSVTEPEKLASLAAYGKREASRYEYDHLVPLELGGAVNDPRNLWPELNSPGAGGFYQNPKDHLENTLKRRVCDGLESLAAAQHAIASNWAAAYRSFG